MAKKKVSKKKVEKPKLNEDDFNPITKEQFDGLLKKALDYNPKKDKKK